MRTRSLILRLIRWILILSGICRIAVVKAKTSWMLVVISWLYIVRVSELGAVTMLTLVLWVIWLRLVRLMTGMTVLL